MGFQNIAIALVKRGFTVFPVHGVVLGKCTCQNPVCKSPGKHPAIKAWQAFASRDLSVLNDWGIAYPLANVGILTGRGLLVLDFDDMASPLAQELLPLCPATLASHTGREFGMHRFYRIPVETILGSYALGGVDIRCKGGFVVGSGSIHKSGRCYEWIDPSVPIENLPPEVLNFLLDRVRKPRVTERNLGAEIPKGQRHDWLRGEIYRRVLDGVNKEELHTIVEKHLCPKLQESDMPQHEINQLIDGAYAKVSDFTLSDLTEVGSAEKFVAYWQDNLVYLTNGEWLQQQEGLWVPTAPVSLWKPVRKAIYEANVDGDAEHMKRIGGFFHQSGTYRFADSVVKFATPSLTKEASDFSTPSDMLPFKNGMLDMLTGAFRPFQADDHVVATLLCAYDVSAVAPKWIETIRYITGGDPEIIRYHQQIFGYLCGTRTMRGVFFFVGPKATGKTTLIGTLARILGPRLAGTAQLGLIHATRSFSDDEDMARAAVALVGRRFVFMDETKKDAIIDPAKFKRIASRDTVLTARYLRYNAFNFVNKAKVVILTNTEPNIDVDDDAAWGRVVYLPFTVSIDPGLQREGFNDELFEEASGIMNWCIAGFRDYVEYGLIQPVAVGEKIEEWQTSNNPLAQFVEESCVVDPGNQCTPTALYDRYLTWRPAAGFGKEEGRFSSIGAFSKSLQRLLGDKISSGKFQGKRVLSGITLR